MATTQLGEATVNLVGELPAVGSKAPAFSLTGQKLEQVTLEDHAGKKKVLNIFPSVDTGICAKSVHEFFTRAGSIDGVVVLNISADLPFAAKRFCAANEVAAQTLSTFRSSFGTDYGAQLADSGMAGLLARAVLVLDADDNVVYQELVPSIGQEPDYDAALAALG